MANIEPSERMNCILQHGTGIGFENQNAGPTIPPYLPSFDQESKITL